MQLQISLELGVVPLELLIILLHLLLNGLLLSLRSRLLLLLLHLAVCLFQFLLEVFVLFLQCIFLGLEILNEVLLPVRLLFLLLVCGLQFFELQGVGSLLVGRDPGLLELLKLEFDGPVLLPKRLDRFCLTLCHLLQFAVVYVLLEEPIEFGAKLLDLLLLLGGLLEKYDVVALGLGRKGLRVHELLVQIIVLR